METVAENLYTALRLARVVVGCYSEICSKAMAKKMALLLREIDHALRGWENHLAIERNNRNVVDLVNKAMEVR